MKKFASLILALLMIMPVVNAGIVEEEPIAEFKEDYQTEDVIEEDFFKVPTEYDENLISISGISHIEYERNTVDYHDRVAVCTAPVTIEVKQDLAMFTIVPIKNENGVYALDEESAEFGEWVFDPAYGGDVIPAKKGKTVTLTQPGLYTIFAETTYMGDWTELVIEIPDVAAESGSYDALYTASKVMVNGEEVQFEAYNIADNNYFKLRDIAFVLSGTSKQFEVTWDEANKRVNMMSGTPYTSVGGELAAGDGTAKTATNGTSNIGKDGTSVSLKAYLINGNNYFKLRDLGKLFDFGVSWDGANNCVLIDSESSYTE